MTTGEARPGTTAVERELHEPVALCLPDGRLDRAAIGWARRPLVDCTLPGPWGRRKRWDFWSVTGPGFAMNLTCAHVDYAGTVDVWFHDLERDETAAASRIVPVGRGITLAERAGRSRVDFAHPQLAVRVTDTPTGTEVHAAFDTAAGRFEANVAAPAEPEHESLTVVIPWSDRRYQCTTKDVARPATGTIRWGAREHRLDGAAWACLDFGRGKWPYRTVWNWGAAAGTLAAGAGTAGAEGAAPIVVGLQLGGKWTDGTGMTENALVVDGRLSKISDELEWTYDPSDWLRPWRVRAPVSGRVDLTFSPTYDKVTRMQLGLLASSVDQCFGTWAGTIVPDGGEPLEVRDLFGWAEEATWRW